MGNIQGEKNDPIPAIAETIILISAIKLCYLINKKGYSHITPRTIPNWLTRIFYLIVAFLKFIRYQVIIFIYSFANLILNFLCCVKSLVMI